MEHYVNFKEELQQRTAYAEEVIRKWLPEEEGFALTMAQSTMTIIAEAALPHIRFTEKPWAF